MNEHDEELLGKSKCDNSVGELHFSGELTGGTLPNDEQVEGMAVHSQLCYICGLYTVECEPTTEIIERGGNRIVITVTPHIIGNDGKEIQAKRVD